ncbi:glycosyltransferase family 2 protein [Halalkalicoccus subterraneus]|uniref:glycosyltransferase family 2 protein n=1 Tax=Halalkalicoccus subterraneus TaxID=2675002 RepID=UPI001FEB6E05|nr:glycosyltransferase family 2 protein [Halalkalicoccus subterraneus]
MQSSPRRGGAVEEPEWGEDGSPIGLIATHTNKSELIQAILSAKRHGSDVAVTHVESDEPEGVEIARMMGARILRSAAFDGKPEAGNGTAPKATATKDVPPVTEFVDPATITDQQGTVEPARLEKPEPVFEMGEDAEQSTVVVGIPAYNEAGSIANVVGTAAEYGDSVLVVDDGSRDETTREAGKAGATVIEHEYNKGYGTALKTLFRAADRKGADHLVILDADAQHDSRDIPRLVAKQRETGADIVIGSRFIDGATTEFPLYRRVGLSIVNALTNLSMGTVRPSARITDTQSGFRAYNRRAIAGLADDDTIGTQMAASTDILYHAHKNGYEVEEVGISVRYDVENANSADPISHGYDLVNNITTTVQNTHPLISLGMPGFVGVLSGVSGTYWLISEYLTTGSLSFLVTTLSALFLLGGFFFCIAAVILHTIRISKAR